MTRHSFDSQCNNDSSFALENIEIASPCSADWNEMTGSEQVRFCGSCQLNVYNLSAMTRQEAEILVQEKEGRLCVRLYKRQDGTVITQDCPVGLKIRHQKIIAAQHAKKIKLGRNIAAAAVALFAIAGIYTTVLGVETVWAEAEKGEANQSREFKGEMMGNIKEPASRDRTRDTALTGSPVPIDNKTPDGNTTEVGKPAQNPSHIRMGKPAYNPPNKPSKEVVTPKKPCKTNSKKGKSTSAVQGDMIRQGEASTMGRMPIKKD